MPVTGTLSTPDVVVAPGEEEVITLRVRNVGPTAESYSVVTTGLVQGWTIIDPPSITIRPKGEQKVQIALRPPRLWSVPAGSSPLTVRIVSHDTTDEVTLVEGTVSVLSFDDRRLSLAHRVERGRRRGEFDVVLENLGNARASCRLSITDVSNRLTGRFEPPSLGVDAGDSGSTRLIVSARRRNWTRHARSLPFEIHALQEGHVEAVTGGTLLHDPVVSGRGLGRLAVAGGVLLAALVGWFGIVRPAVDDAAERAVAAASASTTTLVPTSDPALTEGGSTGSAVGPDAPGDDFDTRLEVTAPLAGQAVQSYTVPSGKVLQITDVLWQNPNGDEGRFELLRNSSSVYGISLRNFTDYGFALVSPFVFGPGDVVSAQLSCERIGNPGADSCTDAVTLTGRLTDAD